MFRTNIYFFSSNNGSSFKGSAKTTTRNFYGDAISDLNQKEITYYGFDRFIKKVKFNNPAIPSTRFDSEVPTPFSYSFYPIYFERYLKNEIDNNLFFKYFKSDRVNFLKLFFLKYFCSIFNISPYVDKTGLFRTRTFSGFTLVSLWYNLHFFLPYIFNKFSEIDIKGTYYDNSFSTILIPRQIFCNFFCNFFFDHNKNKFFKFIFIYIFIIFIPIIVFIFFIFPFFSFLIYFFFFIVWRDRIVIRNYFSFSKNVFIHFELWHFINFFYDKIYQRYVSSFIFFCEFPGYFYRSEIELDDGDNNILFDTKYAHIANRIFYYSYFRYFFKYNVKTFFYRIFYFFFNFFGVYHFSQLNSFLNNERYLSLFSKTFNAGVSSNKSLNNYDRLLLFRAYIVGNDCSRDKIINSFEFYRNDSKDINFYKTSIFKWPLLTIYSIGTEHIELYKNWHFSKFNINFVNDVSRFPHIDPDFSNFYARELSSSSVFLSNFSKHDLNRLYGYYVWKMAKYAKFNTSKLWSVFYNASNINVSSASKYEFLPNSCYDNILDSTNSKISYFFSRFGIIFIPEFSIFSYFFSFFNKVLSFFNFIYYFFDLFFCFSYFFNIFSIFKKNIYDFFSIIFYHLYFFFLKSSSWSFFPFFDRIKNFYINFYTFYNYTYFIRGFYFERSINKTFFMEGLEESDDEETHFTDTIEQSFYNYWWQDFELDLDAINFFHDEVYDQFTDVFDYEDDEIDYFNTLYTNDDDDISQHYDFDVHGLSNFRDSDFNFSDEVDQDDFEDSYEDLEHFFSPIEESSSFVSDNVITSVFFMRSMIYDVSDLESTVPHEQYFTGFGPYSSFELHNASYDLYASFWRMYLYNYWNSNVPINEDFKRHINSQLSRYVSYLDKWHSTQLRSGKYIKIPNIIRSFGDLSYTNKNFSKINFEKLTVSLNNALFPKSIVKRIYFPEQIELIWDKIGRLYSNNPNYVVGVLEKPSSKGIFDLISKSGFEFNTSKSNVRFFYFFEKFFVEIFQRIFDKFYSRKYERDFITNFFGQFYNVSSFNGFTHFSPELMKNILDVVNSINKNGDNDDSLYSSSYHYISSKDKFNFINISFFSIVCSLFILFFIRKYEEISDYPDGSIGYNTSDLAYTRLINLFSSIQFSSKRLFYNYLKVIVKRYVNHHNITGEFHVVFEKKQLYEEILNTSSQEQNNLASFDVLGDLGLFWSDLAPNISKVYRSWNDPFLASLFFPEQFYVLLDYANISTFDDEDIDIYEEKIGYFTETSTGDLYDDPYESEASPILEDTSADPDEENFYRGEAVVTTVLYEDLFDEDDEYFNPDMHWYEQIEDEPEFDEWDLDFFDEIEDINIPVERIFFGEFYRKFIVNSATFSTNDKHFINSNSRTSFYSSKKNKVFFGYSNFDDKSVNSLVSNSKFEEVANVYINNDFKILGNSSSNLRGEVSKFNDGFFVYFVSRVLKFFFYCFYSIRNSTWLFSIEYASSLRNPLTSQEQVSLIKHYKKYNYLYNEKFFVEFKHFILNWLKVYESFNTSSRLNHVIFEMIRANLKLDSSIQSPLFHSPYAFSWFEDSNMPTDFKWEFYDHLKNFFELSVSSPFDEDFTVLIDDFIKDFYESEEIQNIRKEHGQEYFEDAFEFGLFILSTFVIEQDDSYFYSENFFYSTLINLYFSRNKKYPLHSDLYFHDIYKVFEDDWNSIQNEVGFYKEDSSAWLNLLDNPPEDDYVEDPVTPFYVSEEQVAHSSKEYTSKVMIFFDAVWEFFSLTVDYHIYWIRLIFKTYVVSYYEAISSFFDKSWFNLSIKYGAWVYFVRSFFSFSFFIICSLYVVFIVPRIVFMYTTSHFQLFISIFFSGVISFFIIIFLLFTLFFSVYQAYKDINEYERSSFYFAAFMSWFTVVWYSIVGYDIYETDDSSSNIFPSVDPDPTLAPDSAMLELSTPETIDFDPNWHDYEGGSAKPLIAPQPVSFGYFVDTFFSQYLNVAHRSLTGHKFRQRFQFTDPLSNHLMSDNIGNYVQLLRRKENFSRAGKGIYGHYASERNINKLIRSNSRTNILKTVSNKNKWVTRYSDLRYAAQRLSRLRRINASSRFGLTVDYNWSGIDPMFSYKDDERELEEEKYYKGRNIYSAVTDHSRYFVRNYYDDEQGDHEIVIWNVHYRPYDWFSSNYLSNGFYNSVKKFKPFNFSFDPKNYYNKFTNYLHFFEPAVKFIDYSVPSRLYFAQKFVYGASVYHYKISSYIAPYNDWKHEVFKRFNPESPNYHYYISKLVAKSTEFNYLKKQAEAIHFKYFYFNRYRYYMSKLNPNSRFFSRVSFHNAGDWPVFKYKGNIDIYTYDYPLFMENMKYKMIGYEKRLELINHHYYLSIKRPPFSFYNTDFFYWLKANFEKRIFNKDSELTFFEQYEFFVKKFFIYIAYSGNKDTLGSKLLDLENAQRKLEQSKRYSFYWTFFWSKTTSKIFDKNSVALPSSALLLNPNYLPANYNNILAIRRHHLDSINFNSRVFSRKQFRRFWYRSAFVPLIDENPIRFSEKFHNFKSYESGLPVSPTFSKRVSDPISKFMRRGLRRPIIRKNYSDFLTNRYYKNFFNALVNFDKTNNIFSEENTSFLRFTDTNLFTSQDLRAFNNYSYDIFYGYQNNYENRKNLHFNNLYAASGENANIFKFLYSYDLINRSKLRNNNYKRFFNGQNSRYYLKQVYRYPFSRSSFRSYYDAINDSPFFRNNVIPAYSHYLTFNGYNFLPYEGVKRLVIPEYSNYIRSYEDRSTSVTNYFRARFNRNSIGNYRSGQYKYISTNILIRIYRTNRFRWGGRHTGGINFNHFKIFRRNYNITGNKFFSSNFNSFPITSKTKFNVKNVKAMSNVLSKLSSREAKSMRYYNVDYDWPGNRLIKEEYILKYPYTNFFVFGDSYLANTGYTSGRSLYPFYASFNDRLFRPDSLQEVHESTPEIFTGPYLIRDVVMRLENEDRYTTFNKIIKKFNVTKNSNMGLFNSIDFINVEHPRSLIYNRKNRRTKFTKAFRNNIVKVSETPYFLRTEGKSRDVKFGLSIKSNVSAYIYGLDRTPIYSKNYSKNFQKKAAFFSYNIAKFDVTKRYSWDDEEFNRYVKNNYLIRIRKNKDVPDDSKIVRIYDQYNDSKFMKKIDNINFVSNLRYFPDYVSPLESYIFAAHNSFVKFYMHSPFPFVKHGRNIINVINNRRDVYRDRVMSRLQKYVASDAFERTYNRVFSGSRVPIINKDPFDIFLKTIRENNADLYPMFEIWADKKFNDNLTLKDIKIIVEMVKNGLITKEEFMTKFRKIENVESKFVATHNIGEKNEHKVTEISFTEFYPKFYSHVNMSDILLYKLKRSRLYNPQFMDKSDLEFIARNSKFLAEQAKAFRPEKLKIFSRQTPSSLKLHEYVINRSLERSEKFGKEIHRVRGELNKFRPGAIRKDSFVINKNLTNYNIYSTKEKIAPLAKRSEFLTEFEKENAKAAKMFNKKKTVKKDDSGAE